MFVWGGWVKLVPRRQSRQTLTAVGVRRLSYHRVLSSSPSSSCVSSFSDFTSSMSISVCWYLMGLALNVVDYNNHRLSVLWHCWVIWRLQNDLQCVEWDVKPYYTIPSLHCKQSPILLENVCTVLGDGKLCLASGHASQHILSRSPSPEIGRL